MISHYLMEGPNNLWTFGCYYEPVVKTGVTAFNIRYLGGKVIRFHDGQTIKATLPSDSYNNMPMGTIYYQIHDKMEFIDDANKLYGIINIGNVSTGK